MSRGSGPQLPLDVTLDPGATFDSFFASGNELAVQLLQRLGSARGEQQIYLHGTAGAGKTHLLQAACHAFAHRGARSTCLALSQLAGRDPDAVLDGLEQLDLVCVDGLEQVLGDAHWERGLFCLVNRLRATGVPLVFAARDAPAHTQVVLPDLASRLQWGPVIKLSPLREPGLSAAFEERVRQLGLGMDEAALNYLLTRAPRSAPLLFELARRLDGLSLTEQRAVTIPLIRKLLTEP